jgi:hypothetical protein
LAATRASKAGPRSRVAGMQAKGAGAERSTTWVAGSLPSDDEELPSPGEEEVSFFDFEGALDFKLRDFFPGGGTPGAAAEFQGTMIWPSTDDLESGAGRFCSVEPDTLQERTLRTTIVSHGAEAACVS